MSYKCSICSTVVPAGKPRLTHAVTRQVRDGQRDREEIAQELAVCSLCQEALRIGMPLAELRRHYRPLAASQPSPSPVQAVAAEAPCRQSVIVGRRSAARR